MYRRKQGLVLGFHGCDASIVESIVLGKEILKSSRNTYDWLGHGSYFWEFDLSRALEFATELVNNSNRTMRQINHPSVLGAVIDLGNCLDLLHWKNLGLLRMAYNYLLEIHAGAASALPQNKIDTTNSESLVRHLDCAVIELLHEIWVHDFHQPPFDSVRGAFWEGKELYPNAGFREKDHIQICVRNPNCIKGLFIPRKEDLRFAAI